MSCCLSRPLRLLALGLAAAVASPCQAALSAEKKTRKASEDEAEVVMGKLFRKAGTVELYTALGPILNQSFVDSIVIQAGLSYNLSETWALGLDSIIALNSDKPDRGCIETFYNDYEGRVSQPCALPGQDPAAGIVAGTDAEGNPQAVRGSSIGPAYLPTRELNSLSSLTAIWTPVYGKQLLMGSSTIHLDTYVTMGLGTTAATFYPKSETLRNGNLSRGRAPGEILDDCAASNLPGVCPSEPGYANLVGKAGRPDPESQSISTFVLSLGQKIHLAKWAHLKGELRLYGLTGTATGFDPVLIAWVGMGLRL